MIWLLFTNSNATSYRLLHSNVTENMPANISFKEKRLHCKIQGVSIKMIHFSIGTIFVNPVL